MKNPRFKHFYTSLILVILMLLPYSLVAAQGALLRRDLPESYTVVENDTLWNIAS
ncbi:MAG: hypothetical protein OXU66_03955 [Gammaproteobacteria bacterium]|nr:hypothetical protein [Gammaproteobacteria bacterium]MDD9958073.1 hypothetical protein [Gammaproteobacteria bacterium]